MMQVFGSNNSRWVGMLCSRDGSDNIARRSRKYLFSTLKGKSHDLFY